MGKLKITLCLIATNKYADNLSTISSNVTFHRF